MVLKYWILHHPGIKVQVNLNLTKSKHMHSNIANGINGFFEEKDFPNIYSCVELCTTLRVPLLQWDLTVKKTHIKSTGSFPVNNCFLRQWLLIKKIYLDDLTLCGRVVLHLKNLKSQGLIQGHWNWLSGSEEDEEPFKVHRQMGRPTERWTDRLKENRTTKWSEPPNQVS